MSKKIDYYKGCYTYEQKKRRARELQQIDKWFRCSRCLEREERKSQWSEHTNNWCKVCNKLCVSIDDCPKGENYGKNPDNR